MLLATTLHEDTMGHEIVLQCLESQIIVWQALSRNKKKDSQRRKAAKNAKVAVAEEEETNGEEDSDEEQEAEDTCTPANEEEFLCSLQNGNVDVANPGDGDDDEEE